MNYPYHLDFSQRLVMKTSQMDWTPSPVAGVERIMLERESSESGRATSLVRYAPKIFFNEHTHPDGEKILVLSGEFCDEHGRYPRGKWIRSPHLSVHHPYVEQEAIILVKTGHLI